MFKLVFSHLMIFLGFTHLLFLVYWIVPTNTIETYLFSSSKHDVPISASERAAAKKELGLSDQLGPALRVFYKQLFNGTWGFSFSQGLPVRNLIFSKAQTTFSYLLPSLFFLLITSLFYVFYQTYPKMGLTSILSLFNSIFLCIPIFVFSVFWYFSWTRLPPSLSLMGLSVLTALPTLNHLTFKRLEQELKMPYIKAVQAKGTSFTGLFVRHLIKPYLWVFVSLLPWWWSVSLGCAIISEPLFRVPGLGMLAFDSFRQQDIPVLLGLSLFWGFGRILLGVIRELLFASLVPIASGESLS